MAGELEALRLAAGQRRHRLAEPHVLEADIDERLQRARDLAVPAKKLQRLADRHVEHVATARSECDRSRQASIALDLEDLGAVARAVAVRAAQVDVGQELHLDVLEAVAAAGRAAAVAGVEAERAGGVAALLRDSGAAAKQLADRVERADVARRVRARGLADRRLVDEHDVTQPVGAEQRGRMRPGASLGLPFDAAAPGTGRPASASTCPSPTRRSRRPAGCSGNCARRRRAGCARARPSRISLGVAGVDQSARCRRRHHACVREVVAGQRVGMRRASRRACPRRRSRRRARRVRGRCRACRSAACITCGSCSTTTSELPASRSRCITPITRPCRADAGRSTVRRARTAC
jgi:hypothetical protein